MMFNRKKELIRVFVVFFSFSLLPSVRAFAAPNITGTSGLFTDSSAITITGSGFGTSGPNVIVYDNFEGGVNGESIKTGSGSATVGKWDRILSINPPKYDDQYTVSGKLAFKGDYTKKTSSGADSASWVRVDNINTRDVFLSYWVMWPTTSSFPCYYGQNCNWKPAWIWGQDSRDDDQVVPAVAGKPDTNLWYLFGNNCPTSKSFRGNMPKGKWFRMWAWIHATETDGTSRRDFWMLSPEEPRPVTAYVYNYTGRLLGGDDGYDPPKYYQSFVLNPWARWCSDCTESAPRFDDVYVATGPNGRARVEIGNAAVYTDCTNLAILTPSSWSSTEITATLRQGSFKDGDGVYIFVVDANGNTSSGYGPVTVGSGTGSPTCFFIGSRVAADPADVSLRWAPYVSAVGYRLERLISGETSATVIVDNTDKLTYKDNNSTSLDTTYTLYPLNSSGGTLTSCGPLAIPGM